MTSNFEKIFGAVAAQQTVEINGRIDNAANQIKAHTASVAAGATIEINSRIDNAANQIKAHTAGTVAQGTAETVARVKKTEENIISAIFAKKEPWLIILSILSAIAIGFLLFWITGHDGFLTNEYDKDWNLVKKTRDVWSWFVVVLIPAAWAVFMIYVTGLGLKKEDR